jgi:hypothetical protein
MLPEEREGFLILIQFLAMLLPVFFLMMFMRSFRGLIDL